MDAITKTLNFAFLFAVVFLAAFVAPQNADALVEWFYAQSPVTIFTLGVFVVGSVWAICELLRGGLEGRN